MCQHRNSDGPEGQFLDSGLNQQQISVPRDLSMHNFIEEDLMKTLENNYETDSTPFGNHSDSLHSVNQFLIMNEL